MKCPKCGEPGAYVGFNSVECRNPKCEHFVIEEEAICPCCGVMGHVPGKPYMRDVGRDTKPAYSDMDAPKVPAYEPPLYS